MTAGGDRRRWAIFAASAFVLLFVSLLTGLFVAGQTTPDAATVAHAALFVAGLAVWLSALQAPRRTVGLTLLALAVAVRLALLPYPPSDDLNRYLWEGRLVLAGESPYAQPAEQAPAAWRDEVWAGMNNKDKRTAYPPGVQLVFAAAVAVAYDPLPLKLTFLAAEAAVLGLLLSELRRRQRPEAHLALFAFSPVMLLGIAGEGHFDSLFVLALVLALRARERGRNAFAWIWLAAAVQVKIIAVLLVPLFLMRGGWRTCWVALPALLVPTLPFLGDLPNLAMGIISFGDGVAYNGFLDTVLLSAGLEQSAARAIELLLLASWTLFVSGRVRDPWRAAFFIFGGLLLLSPIIHFWYLTWILPFLPILPQPGWLLLTGLNATYHQAWVAPLYGGPWGAPEWAWWAQWLPFAVVLIVSAAPTARRLFSSVPFEARWSPPRDISVIVPTVQEGERITGCLEAVRAEGASIREIIVVDGGSSDDTLALAAQAGARTLCAPRGRGRQIAAGLAIARADVIWIVHADVTPAPGAAAAILTALRAAPEAAGGAVGQRFRRCSPLLTTIEWLNAARSALFGLSFGDQGQFVRRAALPDIGGYPGLPLMEDVELSLRLRRGGPVLHLGWNGIVSTRRWARSRAWHRIWTVVTLTATYMLSPRRRRLSEKLFEIYYPIKEK